MKLNRLSFMLISAAALGLGGCAAPNSHHGHLHIEGCEEEAPVARAAQSAPGVIVKQVVEPKGIDTAMRALPSSASNVRQPAHYQHVYIDSQDKNAGSLQTITLEDAVKSNVLASSELQAKRLDKIDPASLKWLVLEKGFPRPGDLEGVGGADVKPNNFTEVHFDVNQTDILDRSQLEAMIKLASRLEGVFYVVGYADETGVEASNVTLSQDRAAAVSQALVSAGVNSTRVKTAGAGVSRTYSTLAENRRASISFRVVK
jgi:outer membrane protein OmpA-like peptidoglycan-associated protein